MFFSYLLESCGNFFLTFSIFGNWKFQKSFHFYTLKFKISLVKKKGLMLFLMPLVPTLRSGRIKTMGHLIGDGNGVTRKEEGNWDANFEAQFCVLFRNLKKKKMGSLYQVKNKYFISVFFFFLVFPMIHAVYHVTEKEKGKKQGTGLYAQ